MLIIWISSQSFTQHARSSLATTDIDLLHLTRFRRSNDGDTKQKTIYYTPWNGRFLFWYNGHLLVFRREYRVWRSALVEKRSLFPALADLHKFLGNCSLSAASSIQSLFRVKLLSMSTKMVPGKGL